MKVGDLVRRKNINEPNLNVTNNTCGIITEVNNPGAPVRDTVVVTWIGNWEFGSYTSLTEPCWLEKIS